MTDAQEIAIDLLARGKSHAEVCRAVGLTPAELYAWTIDDDFAEALASARADRWAEALGILRGGAVAAAESLRVIAEGGYPGAKPGDVLRAATAVLDRVGIGPHSVQTTHETQTLDVSDLDDDVLEVLQAAALAKGYRD